MRLRFIEEFCDHLLMENLTSILSAYEREESRRALGGIYALAGFDYQLRCYLAEFAESLGGEGRALDEGGQLFLEALSDLARQTEGERLVCIQVKRTLTGETLKDAAAEVKAIDSFLAKQYPDLRDQVKFELVASKGDAALQWSHVSHSHPARSTIDALLQEGRLLPPRLESDPWWRAIVTVWKHLEDPYGFLRFALDRALSRAPNPADAQRLRDEIFERFTQARQRPGLPGQLLTSADFRCSDKPSQSLEIGREITLARMRDQQYMPRSHRLDALHATLLARKDLSLRDLKSEARVFWLSGRSGVGKSVLLLQAVERLVNEGWRVLWLKGQAELLEPAMRAIAKAPADWWPDFIAIDDLYDRDARTRIDLGRLGEFIDERGHQAWPMILTCGPAEFADAFKEDSAYRGFDLHRETVETIAANEAAEIEVWYRERTGQAPRHGPAFSQASRDDNGLFVSLAVELAHGDLQAFAKRFAERVHLNGLDEALRLPLAMNRLYLRAPYDWLSDKDRENLATLNGEGDFSLLEAETEGKIVRLTHPHLADALYRSLRKPANAEAFTNDLIAIFRRALAERGKSLISQLLRVFSAREDALTSERLNTVDRTRLARECARSWATEHAQLALDEDGVADATTSWACWATTTPCIAEVLGADLLDKALISLDSAYKVWSSCWSRLAESYPHHDELFAWASEHLADPLKISHPNWSLDWEHCLQHDPGRSSAWREMGLGWLQSHLHRPDWHFVWKKLLPANSRLDWEADPVLTLGLVRLRAKDGPDWAYVFEDLYALAQQSKLRVDELAALARTWLIGREDRAEWNYVWQTLLAQPKGMLLNELLRLGARWLEGREDRTEWRHVWCALLTQSESLPDDMPLDELLRLGVAWLAGREDCAEWSYVWQAMLEQGESLPIDNDELLRLGRGWLPGREDWAEWSYVWRALVDQGEVLPKDMPLDELLCLGKRWLAGREDRAEWSYVWRALVDQGEVLPKDMPLDELLYLGKRWLAGREDRAEWSYVWQAMLIQGKSLPQDTPPDDLLRLGVDWLPGREDRTEWSYVWRALLAQGDSLLERMLFSYVVRLGVEWLAGRNDRAEWSFIWQELLTQEKFLPKEMALGELLRLGAGWLVGREDQADWAHVWQDLLAQGKSLPQDISFEELLRLGAGWLVGREDTKEWGFVCETMLTQRFEATDFIEQAAAWLEGTKIKPEWPLLAAKFIAVAPRHPASTDFARNLGDRIKACPNSGHWFRTVTLVSHLKTDTGLLPEVRDWLQVLHSRRELPAWAEAHRCLDEQLPVKGTVMAVKPSACSVELEIGLAAVWPNSRGSVRRVKGREYSFFVHALNPDRDFVQVSMDKPGLTTDNSPEPLTIGDTYEGHVTGVKDYGIFLRIGGHNGLLHRSKLPASPTVLSHYSVGHILRVQLTEIRADGKLEFSLPARKCAGDTSDAT
ncbi:MULTISPECIES: S1 RNA-binding domain-containing protein [unclassified Pseudomonas]|uniref:P-loop NTPase n=1 Tax=unclassified Pseudomonas TaxID=196821 RepID=UPI00244AB2AE|nr:MULTISPECIES: S1 RNA-binding domain-containing protein [unclassified Pseudomonas]MDH0303254.1 S1 RNA-binding domain-containing protein [Pseudomonas sp. GD04091]MDH1987478.1 S1 RNA-binding domain-containing protein [Pseudomonas sp. GD03689]